jgi:hypothetical protein
MAHADGRAAMRKVFQFFRERKCFYGHLLYVPDLTRWHFIYFSEHDMDGHHWKGAGDHPHFHFVNYLWPQHSANSVWTDFTTSKSMPSRALHIRFEENDPRLSEEPLLLT